jgi:hypothetical protein
MRHVIVRPPKSPWVLEVPPAFFAGLDVDFDCGDMAFPTHSDWD